MYVRVGDIKGEIRSIWFAVRFTKNIKNDKYQRRAELKKTAYLLTKAFEIADEVYNEAYEVFLEFQIKMRNAEIERLIEQGLIDRDELENEM